MARSFNLVSLAPNLAERVMVSGGETRPESRIVQIGTNRGDDTVPFSRVALSRLLETHGLDRKSMVVVLPTGAVSIRRLVFPFSDVKKVQQAVRYELENETLDGLDKHQFDYAIQTQEDGTSMVLAYLVDKSAVDDIARLCSAYKFTPHKITFSALALYLASPLHSELHFQVYVGAEEVFVSLIKMNRLITVKTFALNPILSILSATQKDLSKEDKFPIDFRVLLDRRSQRARSEEQDNDQRAREQGSPKDLMDLAGDQQEEEGPSQSLLFLYRMRAELKGVLPDINQFIRIHGFSEPTTLSIHGQFAPYLEWNPKSQEIGFSPNPPEKVNASRQFMGILEELHTHSGELNSSAVINFYRKAGGWVQQIVELKRPLAALAVVFAMLITLVGGNLYLGLSGMNQELDRLNREIRAILVEELPPGTSLANGIPILRERVDRLRASHESESRFTDYNYDVMELLREVTELVGVVNAELTVDTLTVTPQRFALSGTTESYSDSESLRNGLTEMPRFEGSEPTIAHQRTAQEITFRITIER